MNRRDFCKILGATGAAATLQGCTRDGNESLLPYVVPVDQTVPAVTAEYATVCRECPAGCGMIALVRDGRCHKVEGNPEHPTNQGRLCLRGQAALQGLYNPDRIRQPMVRDGRGRLRPITWQQAGEHFLNALARSGAGTTAWFGHVETGALDRLIDAWLASLGTTARRVRYEPYAYEPLRAAAGRVLGSPQIPQFRIDQARMLLSFGAEFLETWVSNVEYSRQFGEWRAARAAGRHRGRYVFIAPRLSLTGANADEWIAIRPGTEEMVARALAGIAGEGPVGDVGGWADAAGITVSVLERIGREFRASTPSLALPVGTAGTSARAAAANEAILRLNAAAGNVGRTVLPGAPHALGTATPHTEVLSLVNAMRAGAVSLLFVHGANPAYSLPPSAGFAEALARVPMVVSFSSYPDETTALATLVLPGHTPLESWGEYAPRPGVTGLMQPVVGPVFDTRHVGDLLLSSAAALGRNLGANTFGEYLRAGSALGDAPWKAALQRGGVWAGGAVGSPAPNAGGGVPAGGAVERRAPNSAVGAELRDVVPASAVGRPAPNSAVGAELRDMVPAGAVGRPAPNSAVGAELRDVVPAGAVGRPAPDSGGAAADVTGTLIGTPAVAAPAVPPAGAPAGGPAAPALGTAPSGGLPLRLHLYPSLHLYDGRSANRPWAQEIPDPMAKAVWGSWAEIHPETAGRLGAETGDVLAVSTQNGKVEVPALVTERVHPDAVAIQLGQGHTEYGRYAKGTGVNPLAIVPAATDPESGALLFSGVPVSVARLPIQRPPVVLQTSSILPEHPLAESMLLPDVLQGKRLGKPGTPVQRAGGPSLYANHPHPNHHWGMVIDLDRCIGCNACVAACYAENNVPIVGREDCRRGREMAWLRIENYVGPGQGVREDRSLALDTRFLPMLCQHCDNAPCEYVCPVYATVHDDEGLNEQVYNRCVGTRYCSHNCPYKVRRFEWFAFPFPGPLDQQLNPDVIRRTKGVMEKCSFCIQRIRRHEIDAKAEGRPLRDGEIQTACQQTCPTEAIVFGDYKDPTSRLSRFSRGPRGYGALAGLNTYPNIVYLARVRNDGA